MLSNTQRGVSTSPADRKAIIDAVAELKAANEGRNTTGPESSGTWELLWTTEKVRVGHTAKQGIPVRHVALPACAGRAGSAHHDSCLWALHRTATYHNIAADFRASP